MLSITVFAKMKRNRKCNKDDVPRSAPVRFISGCTRKRLVDFLRWCKTFLVRMYGRSHAFLPFPHRVCRC